MIEKIDWRSKAWTIAGAGLKVFRAFAILIFLAWLVLHLLDPHQFPRWTIMEIMRMAGTSLVFGAFLGLASCLFDTLRALSPWRPRPKL